jgi:hypothetical protein
MPLDCAGLFEEAKALEVYDHFFDLLDKVGYPPPRRPLNPAKAVIVQTPTYWYLPRLPA